MAASPASAAPGELVIDRVELAGIDLREPGRTFPGLATFDAVHRAVRLRFPGIDASTAFRSAVLELEYDGHEIAPKSYVTRTVAREAWAANPPHWHVAAWALRGIGGEERFTPAFATAELSAQHPVARLDLGALLTDPAFGPDQPSRLEALARNGVLLTKVETYDHRYRDTNAAEWAVATGGNGLSFRNPRLVLRTSASASPRAALTWSVVPITAAPMLSRDAFLEAARRAALAPAPALPEWRMKRLAELRRIGGGEASDWAQAIETGDYAKYRRKVREILATPPRFWKGWGVHDDLLLWSLWRDLLPPLVQRHIEADWRAWLMPDIPAAELFHPQSEEAVAYWKKTGDWRGRASFFRGGYNYGISTQNFNHTAAMGALLGGALIGSSHPIADGRHGLEHFPLRLWAFGDGSTQEMLDHYYFSITVSGQKMLADFAPAPIDRLMARIALDRSIELLATAYHRNLRRMVAPSGRTNLQQVLVEQDGIQAALHTLSKRGALKHLDVAFDGTVHGMRAWGYNTPPGRIALQAIPSAWAPDWVTNVIDEKPFPFEETALESTRGNFRPPLWRRMYLGRHFGLASQDIKGGAVDVIAQWNHRVADSTSMEDLGTLTLRYVVNTPNLAATRGGAADPAGSLLTFQHRNRAIVFTRPLANKKRLAELAGKDGITTLASVIALWNFRPSPAWEVYVDGRRIRQFPARIRAGQVLTVKDGVSYVGIVPLPATDLGRRDEILIGPGAGGSSETNGAVIQPALAITSFNLQRETPAAPDALDWAAIADAHGGFVIEMGDAAEHGSFANFSRRMRANKLTARWDAGEKMLHVTYRSGPDLLEAGFSTAFEQAEIHYGVKPGEQTKAIAYRRVNGEGPYLPAGIERDTTFAQQGTTGRLEKNGAVLVTEPGRKAYLQTEPGSGTYTGYNPFPDPTPWSLSVPGGVKVEARGKVGLLRVSVQPAEGRIWVDHALKPGQDGPDMAAHLFVTGLKGAPTVVRNGERLPLPEAASENGQAGYRVPLL